MFVFKAKVDYKVAWKHTSEVGQSRTKLYLSVMTKYWLTFHPYVGKYVFFWKV